MQVPRNSDLQFMAFLVEAFFEYYPRRVGQVLFVDAPWVFQPAWAAIQPLMRKYAALVSVWSHPAVPEHIVQSRYKCKAGGRKHTAVDIRCSCGY